MCNRDVKMLLSIINFGRHNSAFRPTSQKISGDITSVAMTFGQLDRNADQIIRFTPLRMNEESCLNTALRETQSKIILIIYAFSTWVFLP